MLYDVFICHASEDKVSFVRPLARALAESHLEVWYDEFSLRLGDSLRQSIDLGLARSRYGLVVLSPSFFRKRWPQKELDGLVVREVGVGEKVILPIWHKVTGAYVRKHSPTLAGAVAVSSDLGLRTVVDRILQVVRPRGSPLLIARDKLLQLGANVPVISDEWWLDVVVASGLTPGHGFAAVNAWGRWSFPLPGDEGTPESRGDLLAGTALQLRWTQAAEAQRICQMTKPTDVLAFIDSQPGLAETCHAYPLWLADYAPQLTIPGFGGEFEQDFDALLARSMETRLREGRSSGTAITSDGVGPPCDASVALRHPTFGNYQASHIACHFVQGEVGGPDTKLYETIDYAVWLLSSSSDWMPRNVKEFLLDGIKGWRVWHWFDSGGDLDFGLKRYPNMGALCNEMIKHRSPKALRLTGECREDLHTRFAFTVNLLHLPERPEELVERFLAAGFIEAYVAGRP